jgi:hypothetical protein
MDVSSNAMGRQTQGGLEHAFLDFWLDEPYTKPYDRLFKV